MAKSFGEIAAQEGWTPETQVNVLLQYIANQDSDDAFSDFLEQQVADTADEPDMIMVELSREQCEVIRSLAYEAIKHTDDPKEQGLLSLIADDFETAEEGKG